MSKRAKCPAEKTIEDEVCIMPMPCELKPGHDGPHRATYPGLDGDVAEPIVWSDGDSSRAKFHRGRRA